MNKAILALISISPEDQARAQEGTVAIREQISSRDVSIGASMMHSSRTCATIH